MRRRSRQAAHLALAVPALYLCTLYDPGSGHYLNQPSPAAIQQVAAATSSLPSETGDWLSSPGGGPPGGVQGASGRATPTAYHGCGPGARPETGVQGQVPLADQRSGASRAGYSCNMKLVGYNDIKARGANFQLGWYRNCAYVGSVGTREGQTIGGDDLDGVAVIDASHARHPKLVQIVRAPEGVSQHEAVEVNRKRGILVVETGGLFAQYLDVYDVSDDCRNPVFKARYDLGQRIYHGLRITDDGRTVYATDFTGIGNLSGSVLQAIDISDPANPTLVLKWAPSQADPPGAWGVHDLELSRDGNRAYLGAEDPSATQGALIAGPPSNTGPTMVVLDTSQVQARKPNPQVRIISEVSVANFGHAEQRATINGKPYLFTSGETPFGGESNCPWAWGNGIDLSDERHPKVVSEIKLEINQGENCATTGPDHATYSIHYTGIDRERRTTMIFYTYYAGGVRAFDVRHPKRPREIAYYHPVPEPSTAHPPFSPDDGDFQGPAFDQASSNIRYLPKKHELWFVSVGRGFQVLKLTAPQVR
ncbi:MAG: LVIVD repeat-containing protein [Solirubrobacterales bacterium]